MTPITMEMRLIRPPRTRGEAAITNRELVYEHQIHVIGLNIGVLIRAAPQIFGEVMRELFGLLAARVLGPGQPTVYDLADGRRALEDLEARTTFGMRALLPGGDLHHRVGAADDD